MEEEEWKTIENFENYNISSFGRVQNNKTGKIMKLNNKGGYLHISLVNSQNRKSFKVHRLVALAYIENPENKLEVNHKDKNKDNNHLSNLEWNTRQENNIHRLLNLTITNINKKVIFRLDKETNEVLDRYESFEEAALWAVNLGLTKNIHNGRNAISNSVNGLSTISYGHKWQLEKDKNLKNEIWKQVIIEEYIDNNKTYFVSNLGRFKNSSGIIMNNYKINDNGYIRVYIFYKVYFLHRLIAIAFISNPEKKEQVNHKDGNKLNNSLENLEWMTNQENQIHKFKYGLGNSFTRKIIQYDLEGNEINKFESAIKASLELGIGKANIRGVLRNYRKTAGGFIFKYDEK